MKLSVIERILLLNLMPAEGNILEMRTKRDIGFKVGLNAEELVKYQVKDEGGNVTWNPDVEQDTEIELGEAEKGFIKEQLVKKSGEGKLTDGHISLYDKFVM